MSIPKVVTITFRLIEGYVTQKREERHRLMSFLGKGNPREGPYSLNATLSSRYSTVPDMYVFYFFVD